MESLVLFVFKVKKIMKKEEKNKYKVDPAYLKISQTKTILRKAKK